MIIGLATLITILFFGGTNEVFFLDKIEKGVKEYVEEKDRKNEILEDLKKSKKVFKEFTKIEKKKFAEWKSMYQDQNTSEQDFHNFFSELEKARISVQNQVIEERILILAKIQEDEWESIVKYSGDKFDKAKEKALKKSEKKGPEVMFLKTRKVISEVSTDDKKETLLIDGLDNLSMAFESFYDSFKSINVRENQILIDKQADKESIHEIKQELNEARKSCFEQVIGFHSLVKANTNSEQWEKIMKALTKELEISPK